MEKNLKMNTVLIAPFFFLTFNFVLEYSQLTNSVVMVSGEQQKDSDTHIHVSIVPQSPLPFRLPQDCPLSPRIELTLLGFACQAITKGSLQIPGNPALASPQTHFTLYHFSLNWKVSVIPPHSCLPLSLLAHLSQRPMGTPLSDPLTTKPSNRAANLWLPHLALLLTHGKHSNFIIVVVGAIRDTKAA